jgi:HD-like signal output (HDOD) protein
MSNDHAPAGQSRAAHVTHAQARVTSPEDCSAALAFLETLASEVSNGSVNLPCFPDVVIRIRRALDNPETGFTETVKIVGAEPRLAARLLQTANSAVFNQSGKPITDLKTAITRLGTRLVQSSTMAFAVQQMRMAPVLRTIGKPLKSVWEESITVATICQVIARRTTVSTDEAFLTGLLHGIGRLYIMVRAATDPEKVRSQRSLFEMIDSWHPAIGKAVLQNWGFSDAIADAVGNQHDHDYGCPKSPADHADVLIVSLTLAAALRPGGARTLQVGSIRSFHRLDISAEHCRAVLRYTAQQIGALRTALGC